MCEEETQYIKQRQVKTTSEIMKLFDRLDIEGLQCPELFEDSSKPINIALAISGGGYRAMLIGGGALAAFDYRTPNSTTSGYLGGILQSTSYIAGISGGSWLVMSNVINNFRPIYELKEDPRTWALQERLLEGIPDFDPNNVLNKISDSSGSHLSENPSKTEKLTFKETISQWFGYRKTKEKNGEERNDRNDYSSISMKSLKGILKPLISRKPIEKIENQKSEIRNWKEVFKYYKELNIEVRSKRSAGFYLSFTDYWGRALARRIFNIAARAPGATVSESLSLSTLRTHEQPFPIICTIERKPNTRISNKESHLFEFTPFEFGSWDSYLNAFVKIKYLGTSLYDGLPTMVDDFNKSMCVLGFDNVGFITGTSSCLFSHVFFHLYNLILGIQLETSNAINTILSSFGLSSNFKSLKKPQQHPDYALYSPNPFFGYTRCALSHQEITLSPHMYLVDGGDDGQNIPLQPLLQKSRSVDVIFAFDVTSDFMNYPNGTALWKTKERFHNPSPNFNLPSFSIWRRNHENEDDELETSDAMLMERSVFPYVPDPSDFMRFELFKKPTFFGCDLERDYPPMTTEAYQSFSEDDSDIDGFPYLPPVIIFNSNYNYSTTANTSTFQLSYTKEEVSAMIQNGYNMATNMNSTYYAKCVGCAIMKRHFDRMLFYRSDIEEVSQKKKFIPSFCQQCYDTFCWTPQGPATV